MKEVKVFYCNDTEEEMSNIVRVVIIIVGCSIDSTVNSFPTTMAFFKELLTYEFIKNKFVWIKNEFDSI